MDRLPDLTGKTVLVVGGAVCAIDPFVAEYVIAASSGIVNVPNADMLVSIDNAMPPQGFGADVGFTGVRVVGVPSEDASHIYIPFPYENVRIDDNRVVHMRNNGISAIRIAASRGAKRIVLAGFAPEEYDRLNEPWGYAGVLAAAIPALIGELAAAGVIVEYFEQPVGPPPSRRADRLFKKLLA